MGSTAHYANHRKTEPTCNTEHLRLADYDAAIDSGWQLHLDSTCLAPDSTLDAMRAQQPKVAIVPLVAKLMGNYAIVAVVVGKVVD